MIKPIGDRVVIKPAPDVKFSEGGIERPDIGIEVPVHGEVLAVGLETKYVTPGDHVLYGKYSGSEISVDGEKLLIMREDEILGVLQAESKVALP